MLWVFLLAALAGLLWGAWPRPAGEASGRGADTQSLDSPRRQTAGVRVATFNIHGGKGVDGRRDIERTARDLQGVDVAALQEVHDTWGAPHQAARLAGALGVACLTAPTRRRWFRPERSNVLLTRVPVGEWRRIRLDRSGGRGFHFRNLTIAQLELRQPLWVLFTHLNRGDGRDQQLETVMRTFLDHWPAVLMGDFNMTPDHPALKAYLERGDIDDPLGSLLDDDAPRRIDWVLCRGVGVKRAGRVDSGASDHPLYWCDIEV